MKNLKELTILHSNDMHGDFLAEQIDEKLVGGVSLLSGYVNMVRRQEKNVLYAIAGDMFRGSVIDSEYKGVSTIGIMNLLGPDVATIGNHEVDYGLAHLLFLEKCANFPIINANFHIRSNHKRLFQPLYIAEIDGMKILFIGIITEDVLAQTKAEELIGSFVDIGEAAQEVGNICNAYNAIDIDFTVLLTHIGFEEDKKLAALLDPAWGVDVIIGGHSHTFLEEPVLVNDIYIVQAGTGTDQIGRFDIMVDTDRNAIDSFTWQLIPINNETCQKDEEMEQFITQYKQETDKKYDRNPFYQMSHAPFPKSGNRSWKSDRRYSEGQSRSGSDAVWLRGNTRLHLRTCGTLSRSGGMPSLRRTCVHAEGNRCSAGTDASVYSA